jgi:hypothetical protein
MKTFKCLPGALLIVLLVATISHANILLNGDFESNSASATLYNLSNTNFNAVVANVTAFGTAGEIDLVMNGDYGISPQSGNWKLGVHTQSGGNFDGFTFDLLSPIVSGVAYELTFYAAKNIFATLPSEIQIGISNSSTDFGALIFQGSATSTNAWTKFDYTFNAPTNALFLTVRSGQPETYSFVDNFSLNTATSVPEPATMLLLGSGLLGLVGLRKRFNA